MKKNSVILFLFFLSTTQIAIDALPSCNVADAYVHAVTERSLFVWSLLDLAEQESIVDYPLFYDELCQASLKLCKEVQALYENNYPICLEKFIESNKLIDYLEQKFDLLAQQKLPPSRYKSAIEIILYYANHFLKNNVAIDA